MFLESFSLLRIVFVHRGFFPVTGHWRVSTVESWILSAELDAIRCTFAGLVSKVIVDTGLR